MMFEFHRRPGEGRSPYLSNHPKPARLERAIGPSLRWGDVVLASVCLAAPAYAQVPAASFCGIDGADVAAIRAKVASDPRFKRDGGNPGHEVWLAEALQAILTLHTAKSRFYPAAVCQQVIEREGTTQIDRQVRCEAKAAACTALDAELDADAGSGDGE